MSTKKFHNEDEWKLDKRVRCLWSPYYLTQQVLGATEMVPHLHKVESDAFVDRCVAGHWKQFIEWPRGFFKTTTFTQGVGMWLVLPVRQEDTDYAIGTLRIPEAKWLARANLHNQDYKQLIAMETDTNAMKKVGFMKSHLESNELLNALFPEITYTGNEEPWNASCIRIRRVGTARHDQEGTFEAIGVGVALQSRHYDMVWEDDLVGERAIKSTSEMEDTIGWHRRLTGAFVDAGRQRRFGVSNRWGYNDLNSYIRQFEPDFIFHTRRAWEIDPQTGKEVPTFPERYPMKRLLEMRAGMTDYEFSCQYLNSPIMPGESALDVSKLHTYTVEEDGRMVCNCGKKFYLSQLKVYMHFDPNQARARSVSRPCVTVVGLATDKHTFLIDFWMQKKDYGAVFRQLVAYNDAYRPMTLTYEDVGAQNMFEYHLRALQDTEQFRAGTYVNPEAKRGAHRRFPRIEGVPTKSKASEVRIKEHFFPVVENGKFSYRPLTQTALTTQLKTFPHPAMDHDYDLLVTLAQGAIVWRHPESADELQSREIEEDEYRDQLGKPYCALVE